MKNPIWLVGASKISQDYLKVLVALKKPFEVIGRRKKSALSFYKKTRHNVKVGGVKLNLKSYVPNTAIVAVGVDRLFQVSKDLIKAGTKRILLEKPGSLNLKEISLLNSFAKKNKTEVLIAYNRRFYSSVLKMKSLIKKDGGIKSTNFEFTEISKNIDNLKKSNRIKNRWLIANSHVLDLVFYLCGRPKNWKNWTNGKLNWHQSSARFCGSGITEKGIMFSYLSDWLSPGSWKIEFMTKKNRYILKPMEILQTMKLNTFNIVNIKLNNFYDKKFKPGLYQQTKKFLLKQKAEFCTLSDQVENIKIYNKIARYKF